MCKHGTSNREPRIIYTCSKEILIKVEQFICKIGTIVFRMKNKYMQTWTDNHERGTIYTCSGNKY